MNHEDQGEAEEEIKVAAATMRKCPASFCWECQQTLGRAAVNAGGGGYFYEIQLN